MALGVGQDLHLDVAGALHGLLDEHRRVAEGTLGLPHRRTEGLAELLGAVHPAHPATAAAGDGLHEDRETDLLGPGDELVEILAGRGRLQGRYAGGAGRGDRGHLVAGHPEHLGGRADEGQPVAGAGVGELRVLRQEAVAGVDRVRAGFLGGPDDLVDVQVGADRVPLLPDLVRLIGLDPMLGVAVLVGKDRNGPGTELDGGAEGTDGDLAAVGDQYFGEHGSEVIDPQ